MSKRIRVESPALTSWEEADQAMLRMGQIDMAVEGAEAMIQTTINEAKAALDDMTKPLLTEKKALVAQLQQFAEARRADLGDKKSRRLVFGELGFRLSTRLKMLLKRPQIIERLKALDLTACLRVKTEIDAKRLAEQPKDILKGVGCELEVVDAFWAEPDRAKIEELRG
jgi:phage host-nuclease inhibitor protein Gam